MPYGGAFVATSGGDRPPLKRLQEEARWIVGREVNMRLSVSYQKPWTLVEHFMLRNRLTRCSFRVTHWAHVRTI